ncbi:acetylcholine receptor subunit beta isoform X4 [Rhipicephalus sanguineus]|uniref:acetylcholine receptor subunit beta isoform X4 n=1 Tax=Rhipicephalus sanguineus TaxID=34632 RepID=UPI0018931D9B|nr:acetylcholine receptor subunit beta isoform X4 [Rhipicephalus sanguineus]
MRMLRLQECSVVLCYFVLCLAQALDNRAEQTKRIKDNITNTAKYRRTARPQTTANETTVVSFELKAVSVPCLSWRDKRVGWDPKNYGGVDSVFLNSSEIWTPSIIELSPLELSRPRDAMVSLTSAGEATWCPLYSISGICETDMSDFPFDRHSCHVAFTNAMSQEKDVNLTLAGQPTLPEQEHSEFAVLSIEGKRSLLSFQMGEFEYPEISFHVLLERRTSLHLFTVLLPTVAVVLLSLLVFWLPPESERKLTLVGAALLMSLLLLYRADETVSYSGKVPRIVKVVGGGVLMNALIAASAVLSTNMARSPPSCALPVFLVKLSEFVAHRLPCPCPAGRSGIGDDEGGVQNKSFNNAVAREWYTAARALDRVLGLVFTAAYVVLCL